MRYVQIILGWSARPPVGETPVGNELAVRIEDRIGPQARGQDVGAGLGNLHGLGPEVEVVLEQKLDRLVERQPVGGALAVLSGRQRQRAVKRSARYGQTARGP